MNNVEIRDKISQIVWSTSPVGAENAIMQLIEKVQEEAYQDGLKDAKKLYSKESDREKVNKFGYER